jgi:hypothetical protein
MSELITSIGGMPHGKLDANGVEDVLVYIGTNGDSDEVKIELGKWMKTKVNGDPKYTGVSAIIYDNPVPDLITQLTGGQIKASKVLTVVLRVEGIDIASIPEEERRNYFIQYDCILGMDEGKIVNLFDMADALE